MANESTWANVKTSKWRQILSSEFSGANIITQYRWWHSMAIQNIDVFDDVFYVAEEVTIDVIKYVNDTDPVAVTEAIAQTFGMTKSETAGLVELVAKEVAKSLASGVSLTELTTLVLSLGRNASEPVGVTETSSFDFAKALTEALGVSEVLAKDVTRPLSDQENVTDSSSFVFGKNSTDAVGITDESSFSRGYNRSYQDSTSVTDTLLFEVGKTFYEAFPLVESIEKTFSPLRSEWVDLSDTSYLDVTKSFSDSAGISETSDSHFDYTRNATDAVGTTEEIQFALDWYKLEQFLLDEMVSFDVTWLKEESLAVTESYTALMQLLEDHSNAVGITDEIQLTVWDTSLFGGDSIVDIARREAKAYLGLTDAEVADLSIHDLAHMYWAERATRTVDRQLNSIYDHFRTVSSGGRHWITDIEG